MERISDQVLIDYIEQRLSSQEREQVEDWLRKGINQQTFARTKTIWTSSRSAAVFDRVDTKKGLESVFGRLKLAPSKRSPALFTITPLMRIAASVAFVLLLGVVFYLFQSRSTFTEVATTTVAKTFQLPDGSKVTLNRHSTLQLLDDMTSTREMKLTGEAFFEVRKDKKRPFIVRTSDLKVRVLGTSFDIKTRSDSSDVSTVSVATGIVEVSTLGGKDNIIELEAYEAVAYSRKNGRLLKGRSDTNFLAWKTGIFSFSDTPLSVALESLARYHQVTLQYDLEDIRKCRVTAVFEKQSWKDTMKEMALILPLDFRIQADGSYMVTSVGCKD